MKIAVGADHNGYRLKQRVAAHLIELGHHVADFGCDDEGAVDYPDIAAPVARAVGRGDVDRAILVCGTGLGMAITANKIPGVAAASVTDPYSAERARKSNNAQILCLGAKVVGDELAILLVDHWLSSEFAGGDSARKVAKIEALERATTSTTFVPTADPPPARHTTP
jgi:ribose 5-phosphate isomerase B